MAMKQLHPGARWAFRLRAFGTVLFLMIIIASWLAPLMLLGPSMLLIAILLILVIGVALIEIYARLAYKFWGYEFTKTELRLERGIIWKRYSNIPYERVQNVDITRGIIARICGFSTVNIQTAGYSAPAGNHGGALSEGHIPAVPMAEAEKIREFVLGNISKRGRRQGL